MRGLDPRERYVSKWLRTTCVQRQVTGGAERTNTGCSEVAVVPGGQQRPTEWFKTLTQKQGIQVSRKMVTSAVSFPFILQVHLLPRAISLRNHLVAI